MRVPTSFTAKLKELLNEISKTEFKTTNSSDNVSSELKPLGYGRGQINHCLWLLYCRGCVEMFNSEGTDSLLT